MNDLIKKLVEAYGPSGFEDQIREMIQQEISDHADDVAIDSMGNLIAHKAGNGSGLKIMIAAHMDEIGVIITHITDNGFLRFTNIGGIRRHTLMGNRVRFANGVTGLINSEKLESIIKVHGLDKHYIDIGAKSPDDCSIEVGDAAGFSRSFIAQGSRLTAKSMDDRIGCVVGIEALRKIRDTPHDIYFVFTVQEEVGTRGAEAAANALNVDVGIALDVTGTGDTPNGPVMAVELGRGPAIKVKDGGMIAHSGFVRHMRALAEEAEIPYQLEVLEGGSTDARSMQIAGAGCAAGCISIPCRYVHSQSETVDAMDVENTIKLLVSLLEQPIDL